MFKRQLFTMKFKSSRLKEYKYNIELSFDEAKANGEIVALSDNQILRSIRNITGKCICSSEIESLYSERDKLRKLDHSIENVKKIKEVQKKINDHLFIPEYITIVMEHKSHYTYLFNNGLTLNGNKFIRFSCSASQARLSTVVFCKESIVEKLDEKLDNGRDKDKELTPSKFNAYKGLAGSATKIVSTPRFCVVPDYIVEKTIKANFVTETPWDEDDKIEVQDVSVSFNRFDGQGLISPKKAAEWAKELNLDYVPSQWCIRQNYIKGMLCTFDIHEFCRTENQNQYAIKSIYKDIDGNPICVNLNDIDVIISESQFKLWNSFDSLEKYKENCEKNGLHWGVSLCSPKEPKDILKMNYQFIQTLNWNLKDIKKVCEKFVNWIDGVNFNNIYYTFLFLLGEDVNLEYIYKYFKSEDNYWIKCLILNPKLKDDSHFRNKIYELIKHKIHRGCMGDIIVDGNFQTVVSDPYAMMQYVCGQEVSGLLKSKEYYSNYWNNKGIKNIDSMRAPLTYRSEHMKLSLTNNEKTRKWYKHCDSGIIVNVFGQETLHWAGSDFDMDTIATTSDPIVLKGVYSDELPVVYEAPKAKLDKLTPEKLFEADLFAFGSKIGSITNKSTSGFALLPLFDVESDEYKTLMNRLKMCTKLQSAQIDKAKIGREVKGIPKVWTERQKIDLDNDSGEDVELKEFMNSILLDRHPYFFIYLYKDTMRKYKKYVAGYDLSCLQKFGLTLDELKNKKRKSKDEASFLEAYYRFLPVIESNSVMNSLCKYIESIDFDIKNKIKTCKDSEVYKLLLMKENIDNQETYLKLLNEYKRFNRQIKEIGNMGMNSSSYHRKYDSNIGLETNGLYHVFRSSMEAICSNPFELTDYLVRIFYKEFPSSNKDLLWNTYGKYIFENLKLKNNNKILFPLLDQDGDIDYLNKKYSVQEVII